VQGEEKTLIPLKNSYLKLETANLFKRDETTKEISIYSVNTETEELKKDIDMTVSRLSQDELDKQTETVLSMMNGRNTSQSSTKRR
jgi:hypothetical protein